nr:MAG TPA: hypothetical protein [Caudoviricetes sp.]
MFLIMNLHSGLNVFDFSSVRGTERIVCKQ